MPSLKRGLELLAQRGQLHKLHRASQRIVAELNARGLTAEAAEIESFLKTLAAPMSNLQTESVPVKRPALPTHCPSCGAALRPDEVDWLDDVTAECEYCGSPVRNED